MNNTLKSSSFTRQHRMNQANLCHVFKCLPLPREPAPFSYFERHKLPLRGSVQVPTLCFTSPCMCPDPNIQPFNSKGQMPPPRKVVNLPSLGGSQSGPGYLWDRDAVAQLQAITLNSMKEEFLPWQDLPRAMHWYV